jgi:prevent-host-death family protein
MATIPQRELRNNVGEVLRRAEAGERIVVTVDGRPVAELGPVSGSRSLATLATLRRLGSADADWLADQDRLRDEDHDDAADPWA